MPTISSSGGSSGWWKKKFMEAEQNNTDAIYSSYRCRLCGLYAKQHYDVDKAYDHDFFPAACPHSIGDGMCPACKGESPSTFTTSNPPPDLSSVDEMIRLVCLPEVMKQAEAEYGTLVKVSFTGFRFRMAQNIMQGDIVIVAPTGKTLKKIPVALGATEELRTCITILEMIRKALDDSVSKVFGPKHVSGPQRVMHDDMDEDMFGNEGEDEV